jgi:hypothetical protein
MTGWARILLAGATALAPVAFAWPPATDASPPATDASPPPPGTGASPPSADASVCPPPATPEAARRRPGQPDVEPPPTAPPACDPTRLAPPSADQLPAPQATNRWRIIDQLGHPANLANPYETNNVVKGDRPVFGGDWFFAGTATVNSLLESRRLSSGAPAGGDPSTARQQFFDSQTASIDTVLYKGDTVFRPPDYQLRFTPVLNYSSTRTGGVSSSKATFGAQALFVETHLRDVSAHYDFDSLRAGIQPLTSDFRGFVLADQPLAFRLFGTRANGIYQYNIAWFRRLPKNTARQNEFGAGIPANDVLLTNLYVQDLGRPGLTSEFLFMYDRSRVGDSYDVGYLGYSVDGHVGWLNLTSSLYGLLGRESGSTLGTTSSKVRAAFAAVELSRDFDWMRVRMSALYASGDATPGNRVASGFDGISQSALFAGSDASFFIHQRLPLVLDGIDLKQRDSLFPDLRSPADSGKSNFENPGLRLLGLGFDADVAPLLRLSFDVNHLWFDKTGTLAAALGRPIAGRDIGFDVSVDAFYRPLNSQNLIIRLTAARLFAAQGARALLGTRAPMSAFLNLVLTY